MASNSAYTATQAILQDLANQISAIYVAGTSYPVKDLQGRVAIGNLALSVDLHTDEIEKIKEEIHGGITFIGRTTTELSDGSTQQTVVIDGKSVTAKAGNLVIGGGDPSTGANSDEFIWDGTKWILLGSTGNLGNLAFADRTTAEYTPAGTVSVSESPSASLGYDLAFSGTAIPPAGTVDIPAQDLQGSFTGTQATISATLEMEDYTPSGSVSQVVTSVSPGSASTGSAQYGNETLSIIFGSALTSVGETTGNPTFTGTAAKPSGKFSTSYTPNGQVSAKYEAVSGIGLAMDDYTPQGELTGTITLPAHGHSAQFTGISATITGLPDTGS